MENHTIKITGDLTKDATENIRKELADANFKDMYIVLDMSEVIHIDDSGILFLIQLHEFVKSSHVPCTLDSLSPELFRLVTIFGLHDLLTIRSAS